MKRTRFTEQQITFDLRRIWSLVLIVCLGYRGIAWPAEQPFFTDITETSGIIRLVEDCYASNPKWWLSGLHLVDLDGDEDLDLFLSAHGRGDALAALNDGLGHFARATGEYPSSEIHLCYDSDEDGRVDLTMTYQDGGGRPLFAYVFDAGDRLAVTKRIDGGHAVVVHMPKAVVLDLGDSMV